MTAMHSSHDADRQASDTDMLYLSTRLAYSALQANSKTTYNTGAFVPSQNVTS